MYNRFFEEFCFFALSFLGVAGVFVFSGVGLAVYYVIFVILVIYFIFLVDNGDEND